MMRMRKRPLIPIAFQALLSDLFDGEELAMNAGGNESIEDMLGDELDSEAMHDIEKDLDTYAQHEIIKEILQQGRVQREFAIGIDERLRTAEMEGINEYIQESSTMVALHEQIRSSDAILANMELLLGKFQTELGRVSEEIRQLQVQSQTMGTKLRNRRATEQHLGAFVEQMAVSEPMVVNILDAEVNEDYLEYLLELNKKLKFMSGNEVARASLAKRELDPPLEKLRIKAVSKVRDFLMNNISLLKRPKTNLQIIQQTSLLKYKHFIRFLAQHGADIYAEVKSEYISVMSRILAAHFRTYLTGMEKMVVAVAHQADVLGVADPNSQSASSSAGVLTGLFHKGPQGGHKGGVPEKLFELGDRSSVLEKGSDQPALIPHVAESEGQKFPYEVVFRNVHKLLMDTATTEFLFCCDFFEDEACFRELFSPIVSVVEGDLAQALQDNWDMLSVLLMIRINHAQRQLMNKRRIPCLDDYLDRVQLMLWPRFKVIFDGQLASVKSGAERSLFQDSMNHSPSIHGVAKRYAALASSMFVLMAEYDSDESGLFKAQTFYDMMDRLWASIFDLLLRMSNLFKDKVSGMVFLIINYAHMVTTFRTADATAPVNVSASLHQMLRLSGGGAAPEASTSAGVAAVNEDGQASAGMGKTGATAIRDCEVC